MNLGARLRLLLLVIVLVAIGGATVGVVLQARQSVADELQSTMDLSTLLFERFVRFVPPQSLVTELTRIVDTVQARHLDIQLREGTGAAVPPPMRATAAPAWFVDMVEPAPVARTRRVMIPGTEMRLEIRADPADELSEAWWETRRTLFALLALACALIWLFLRWGQLVLRPLTDIATALSQVEAKKLGTRLQRHDIPEIDFIVDRFNRMAEAQERDAREVLELTRRSLMIREEERRHLAHELHDEMGQSISAIKALAVSISRRSETHEPKVKQSADTIADVSSHVYERVRQMMSQLRPTTLDELGLVAALADMIDTWNSHHESAFCTFTAAGVLPPLTATQNINLFRIVQEALTNIAKHAGARHAMVTLEYASSPAGVGGDLVLRIGDDGRGFDVLAPHRGLGLVGLHERVRALGGKMALASDPENGTQFEVTIPINQRTSDQPHEQDSHPAGR